MKKLIVCFCTALALSFAACTDDGNDKNGNDSNTNPAEKFVGKWNVDYTANLTVTTDMIGERNVNVPTRHTTATITLDGTEGRVKVLMDGHNATGVADEKGLHLDKQSYSETMQDPPIDFLQDLPIDFTITHNTIPNPVDGKMSWTSNANGNVSYSGLNIPVTGTMSYTATKQ